MKTLYKFIVLMVLLFLNQSAYSYLSSSLLSDLISDSDIIAVAKVKKIDIDEKGNGHAELEVIEIIKGNYKQKEIKLSWSDEVHDQRHSTTIFENK